MSGPEMAGSADAELDLGTGPTQPTGWKQAWDLRPPEPGEPDHAAYKALIPQMIAYNDALIAASEPAPGLQPSRYFDGAAGTMVEPVWEGLPVSGNGSTPTGTVRWRTLADVPDDPLGALLFGMFEPTSNACIASPGVGKSTTGAWICREALAAGLRPMVYDAERRPREWSRRTSGLGCDRSRIVYLAPEDLPRSHMGRPLWDVAPALGLAAVESGADLLLVDSILPAVGLGEERLRTDAQTPFLYAQALEALGMPTISFGHPPKGQSEGDPFGSFAWIAAMRMVWTGTRAEGEGHRIRWRPRKRNERGFVPGVLLMVEYGEDGRPCAVTREDDEQSTAEWIMSALVRGPRGVAELADELLEESEDHVSADVRDRTKERLSRTLRRMAKEGAVQRDGPAGGRSVRWSLRWSA